MAQVLTTKEDVKIWLEDIAGVSSFDALLDALILTVSQKFELAANRKLFEAEYVELHDGGGRKIYVRNPPVTEIDSIIYVPNHDIVNGTALGTEEYVLDPSSKKDSIYSTFGQFLPGIEALQVTYTGGYVSADQGDDSTVPDFLRTAATQQVVYMFKNRKTLGLDNVDIGGSPVQKVNHRWLLPEVIDTLKQIRVRNIH